MAGWAEFFTAEAGASAALAGLVIVAISINIGRILALPYLPGRAAETLIAPTGALVISTLGLVPGQPPAILGIELALVGAVMWLVPMRLQWRAMRSSEPYPGAILLPRIVMAQLASVPFIVAGVLLVADVPGALYWVVPGLVAALVTTVVNSWILLVEILR